MPTFSVALAVGRSSGLPPVEMNVPPAFVVVQRITLEDQAVERLELRITENVVIQPVWMLGDPYPHLDDELELVMGPMRATAERILDRRRNTVTAARKSGTTC